MRRKINMKIGLMAGIFLAFAISGCAPVTISSVPSGARVYAKDGEGLVGTTPLKVNLVATPKELVVRKEGYFSKSVTLSPIDPKSLTVKLSVRDKVLLLSQPDGAELYVDDERIGRTPYRLDYSKPERTFEVRAVGYAPINFTIPEDPEGNIMINLARDDAVVVQSIPRKAEVFTRENKSLGITPLAIPSSEARFLEMRKEGYYSKEFSIDEHTESPFMLELKRQPIIIVYSDPEDALVIHRGVTMGRTPYRQLVQGDMELEIVAARHYTKTITISEDSPRTVNVELEEKPYVTIDSNPSGAQLFRSGGVELIGNTPIEVLVEKDTAFEVHKKGFDIKPFVLSPESNPLVTVPLKKSIGVVEKVVTIDSEPSGAKVYRPGGAEFIGTTPIRQHVRGERTFELQLEGFKTKIVTVAPDSADNVTFALSKDDSERNVTVSDPLLNTPSSF